MIQKGFRLATSVGGVLTGRGADFIILDDAMKPDEALSDPQRSSVNAWFDGTLHSRLNNKHTGCIIVIMQRLHEEDLAGYLLGEQQEAWRVVRFPAIAQVDEEHVIESPFGKQLFIRREGEALHPERESLEVLRETRESIGEYNFAAQYMQNPAPLGGGMVKLAWFQSYADPELPSEFEQVLQSWDTANTPGELSDYSVCTTWGIVQKKLYLLHVLRKRLNYSDLKRTVVEHARAFSAKTVLIEDKASGTQLIKTFLTMACTQ